MGNWNIICIQMEDEKRGAGIESWVVSSLEWVFFLFLVLVGTIAMVLLLSLLLLFGGTKWAGREELRILELFRFE